MTCMMSRQESRETYCVSAYRSPCRCHKERDMNAKSILEQVMRQSACGRDLLREYPA